MFKPGDIVFYIRDGCNVPQLRDIGIVQKSNDDKTTVWYPLDVPDSGEEKAIWTTHTYKFQLVDLSTEPITFNF